MNVAFIPVRGGSKSIPLKNIKIINGKPLVYWTIKAACNCLFIDNVYVSTDSDIIRKTIEGFKTGDDKELFSKVNVINRSAETASDTASTESAMLEFAYNYDFDNVVLIQATSPLLNSNDINRGFEVFNSDKVDSVISVVKQKRFQWKINNEGYAYPTNYDIFNRPRRQDFEGYLVENGAFYITSRENLISSKNRISGNIKTVEMSEDTYFEIDEPTDWLIIEELMKKNQVSSQKVNPEIKIFLTDCDGCLTDGGMYYSEYGDELKKFNTRDGMGFNLLKEKGIITGIVTGEDVSLNKRRANKLNLDILISGCKDKAESIREICKENNISTNCVCYIGDDINDINAIKLVGFGCCPSDAMSEVKKVAKYVCKSKGGEGVIREVVEYILNRYGADNIE